MQRIPRYQLLISNVLRHYPAESVQAEHLQDASAVATMIASRRLSDDDRQAAVLWSCQRTISRFPPELGTPGRELLGCIDVDERGADARQKVLSTLLGRRGRSSFALLVFTDALVLVQRHSATPTHLLLGVHEPEKLANSMRSAHVGQSAPAQRTQMTFAGMADLLDVCATGERDDELQFVFERSLRGSSNKSLIRRFVDAQPDVADSHVPLFLDCFWRAQAEHRARGKALAVRQTVSHSAQGAMSLFYTLFTRKQYEAFERKERLLVYLGVLDSQRRLKAERHSELCISVDLDDEMDTCTVCLSRDWGTETRRVVCDLASLAKVSAHMLVLPTLPQLPEAPPPETRVASPPRRVKSFRSAKGSAPNRQRSVVNDKVRASIKASLEAMQASQVDAAVPRSPSLKRTLPLSEVGNTESPRRRLRQADGQENEPVQGAQELPPSASATSLGHHDTPTRKSHYNLLDMYADDTLELPNPFDEEGPQPMQSPVLPEPAKFPQDDLDESQAKGLDKTLPDIREETSMDVQDSSAEHAAALPDTDVVTEDQAEKATEASQSENLGLDKSLPVIREDEAVDVAGADAPPADVPVQHKTSDVAPVAEMAETTAALTPSDAQAPQVPELSFQDVVAAKDLLSSEDEVQAMLQPLLEVFDTNSAPRYPIVYSSSARFDHLQDSAPAAPAPLDVTLGQLSAVPEEEEVEAPSRWTPAPRRGLRSQSTASVASVQQDAEYWMRKSIQQLNQSLPLLYRHRAAKETRESLADWSQFKNAIKQLNVSWNDMERAYEDNQMELASLKLAQPDHDPRIHLTPEEYADIQDQLNVVLPLRLQIDKLVKRCERLQELEKDARIENAELYNVRTYHLPQVFNEELAKLYQHSFRPSHEEISMLRKELLEAKEELHGLRKENRALRLHHALEE